MASVGIVIMGFDVADTAVIVLKLTLNKKIGMIGLRQIKVIFAASLAIKRDLEQLAAGLFDRYVVGVESHNAGGLASVRILRARLELKLPISPREIASVKVVEIWGRSPRRLGLRF